MNMKKTIVYISYISTICISTNALSIPFQSQDNDVKNVSSKKIDYENTLKSEVKYLDMLYYSDLLKNKTSRSTIINDKELFAPNDRNKLQPTYTNVTKAKNIDTNNQNTTQTENQVVSNNKKIYKTKVVNNVKRIPEKYIGQMGTNGRPISQWEYVMFTNLYPANSIVEITNLKNGNKIKARVVKTDLENVFVSRLIVNKLHPGHAQLNVMLKQVE